MPALQEIEPMKSVFFDFDFFLIKASSGPGMTKQHSSSAHGITVQEAIERLTYQKCGFDKKGESFILIKVCD